MLPGPSLPILALIASAPHGATPEFQSIYEVRARALIHKDLKAFAAPYAPNYFQIRNGKKITLQQHLANVRQVIDKARNFGATVKVLRVKPAGKDFAVSYRLNFLVTTMDEFGVHRRAGVEEGTDLWRTGSAGYKCLSTKITKYESKAESARSIAPLIRAGH